MHFYLGISFVSKVRCAFIEQFVSQLIYKPENIFFFLSLTYISYPHNITQKLYLRVILYVLNANNNFIEKNSFEINCNSNNFYIP